MKHIHLRLLRLRGRRRHRDVADNALHQDELEPDGYRAKPHVCTGASVKTSSASACGLLGSPPC